MRDLDLLRLERRVGQMLVPLAIGRQVWVAGGAFISKCVTVPDGCVVRAHAY